MGLRVVATILLMFFASSWSNVEFLLPVSGETVEASGTGLLVRSQDSSAVSVRFFWTGAVQGRVLGVPEGSGLFSAHLGGLPDGSYGLRAEILDSKGKILSADSIRFQAQSGNRSPPGSLAQRAEGERVLQNLYVALHGGWRQGLSEGSLRSWRQAYLRDSAMVFGKKVEPFDRTLSADGTLNYTVEQGAWHARLRAYGDLSDQPRFTQSANSGSLEVGYGPWVQAKIGDQNPQWAPLLFDGSRMRGLGLDLAATWKGDPLARLQWFDGWSRRAIRPSLQENVDGTFDTLAGSYQRNIQGVNFSFGDGRTYLVGLTWLHAKEDSSGLDMALQDSLRGTAPRENTAVGLDVSGWMFGRHLEVYTRGAMSLVTENIRLGTVPDSVQNDIGLEIPSFLDPLITLNSSTRGLERFLGQSLTAMDVVRFLGDNVAGQTGIKWDLPLGAGTRIRQELRASHTGLSYESFARGWKDRSRKGIEYLPQVTFASGMATVSGQAGWWWLNRPGTGSPTELELSTYMSVLPGGNRPGFYFDGGHRLGQDGGAKWTNWNSGAGLWTIWRPAEEHIVTLRGGVGYVDSRSAAGTGLGKNLYFQTNYDLQARWKTPFGLEPRALYQLSTTELPQDRTPSRNPADHRLSLGASSWLFDHSLEMSVDAGGTWRYLPAGPDEMSQVDQSASLSWEIDDGHQVRLTERALQAGDRSDLRLDAWWERWF